MHRVIKRLELQIPRKHAAFIESLENEPLHSLDDPEELDSKGIRRG
jgi:hypothetical protein